MSARFAAPAYGPDGVQPLTDTIGAFRDALMDTYVQRLDVGEERTLLFPRDELALLLIEGDVSFTWDGRTERAVRATCFDDGKEPAALHVPAGTAVTLTARARSEVFAAHTENDAAFPARWYPTPDIRKVTSCAGILGGTAERIVTTVFDDVSDPEAHLVLGETYPLPGKWCGYPPHSHPQPEVYYYRIDRPEGFGFCAVGDDAFVIRDRTFALMAHGDIHPHVTAPGYHMYIIWIIRHLPGDPWHRGPNLPEYQWLEKEP